MEENELIRIHPSMRNNFSLIAWPVIAIPVVLWLISSYTDWPAIVSIVTVLALLLFPGYAWLKTKFHTFVVTDTLVRARRGLLSKYTTEIRNGDIRAIDVRQSVLQRILRVGDLGFSSAAGDEEEVVFVGVAKPEEVKAVVARRVAAEKGRGGSDTASA
jgi:uncharacterized membrane protein YdbT with pleckstrin-like domain